MGVVITDNRVIEMFENFDDRNLKKIFKRCVKESLNIIKKNAVSELKKHTNAIDKVDKYNNTLRKGIVAKVYKDNVSGIVHIMGNYKLKWFQNGTVDREYTERKGKKLEKPHKTGKMKATNFFMNAAAGVEGKVFNEMETRFEESIKKVIK